MILKDDMESLVQTGAVIDEVERVKRIVVWLLKNDPEVYMLVCSRARDVVDAIRMEEKTRA